MGLEKFDTMGLKVGDKIRIIEMAGEPHYNGKEGTIDHIDSTGQIFGSWGGLALQTSRDKWERV